MTTLLNFLDNQTTPRHRAAGAEEHRQVEWLQQLYDLVETEQREEASSFILQRLEPWFQRGNFQAGDALLDAVDVERLDTYAILGFLAFTHTAADQLSRRAAFLKRAEQRIATLAPARAERLLKRFR